MTESAIKVDHLSFRYLDNTPWVLRNISFQIQHGENVLLLGPSGCGKSTLALCLKGLIPHTITGEAHGDIMISGKSVIEDIAISEAGIVFQDPESQLIMPRVCEEVAFGLENISVPMERMDKRIDSALSACGLAYCKNHPVEALSTGQMQRLALASIIAVQPGILILDEPTANLDPEGTEQFYKYLLDLKRSEDVTIFLIEHRIDMALPIIDRVILMDQRGRITADGIPRKVLGHGKRRQNSIWLPTACRLKEMLENRGITVSESPLYLNETEALFHRVFPRLQTDCLVSESAVDLENAVSLSSQADFNPSSAVANRVPAVAVQGVSYSYPGGHMALNRADLHVDQGVFLTLIGANGSGKSTLAKLISGLLRPQQGHIHLFNKSANRLRSSLFMKYIGYVFQNPEHQFVTERVKDELAYSLKRQYNTDDLETRTAELLDIFDLKGFEDANPFSLSQGQKRRLSVATMVALKQPILILDEPTFGQDPESSGELMQYIRRLHRQGKTIVMITHDMSLVLSYGELTAVMCKGGIIFQGTPVELFKRPEILAQAHLTPPFEVRLGQRLGDPSLFTRGDWFERLSASNTGKK
jgi:energy-coupling factor transporter ATP-binding protein EcfA2